MNPRRSTLVVAALLATIAGWQLAAAAGPTARAAQAEPCFGAAARDPLNPCANPALTTQSIPMPFEAALEPSEPCSPIDGAKPEACWFGTASHLAVSSFALVGDSHAVHWRAALKRVALARRWRGVSVTRSSCPFTLARTPGRQGRCAGWATRVIRWLRRHPEIRRLVVSANSGAGVIPRAGQGRAKTKVGGYKRAWQSVPKSVREIIVIRDVPHMRSTMLGCVDKAVTSGIDAGSACSRPRYAALRADLQFDAAVDLAGSRVRAVDLSEFMCDEQRCFAVVGGALVIKDLGHLTRTFSRTLGPYLSRALDRG